MKGFSFLELLVVLALVGLMILLGTLNLNPLMKEQSFDRLVREIVHWLELCRWKAVNERIYVGACVEPIQQKLHLSFYQDGNENGIRISDIQDGTDHKFRAPVSLQENSGDIEPAILPGTPEIPPKTGVLNTSDPIRFGKSSIISFSPEGDSSSGTLYLSCHSANLMYAIVLYGPTARIRIWKSKNFQWQMVVDR